MSVGNRGHAADGGGIAAVFDGARGLGCLGLGLVTLLLVGASIVLLVVSGAARMHLVAQERQAALQFDQQRAEMERVVERVRLGPLPPRTVLLRGARPEADRVVPAGPMSVELSDSEAHLSATGSVAVYHNGETLLVLFFRRFAGICCEGYWLDYDGYLYVVGSGGPAESSRSPRFSRREPIDEHWFRVAAYSDL